MNYAQAMLESNFVSFLRRADIEICFAYDSYNAFHLDSDMQNKSLNKTLIFIYKMVNMYYKL